MSTPASKKPLPDKDTFVLENFHKLFGLIVDMMTSGATGGERSMRINYVREQIGIQLRQMYDLFVPPGDPAATGHTDPARKPPAPSPVTTAPRGPGVR